MDIVTRLKMFLEQTGISNSQFADNCAIPRPTLSQLLNGRNKKVSDEVIGKIHRAYPSLNIMWLMFGDGEMLVNAGPNGGNAPAQPSPATSTDQGGAVQRAISFDDDTVADYARPSKGQQRAAGAAPMTEAIQHIMRGSAANRSAAKNGNDDEEPRTVVNIMVYYSDGRFEQFGPLKAGSIK